MVLNIIYYAVRLHLKSNFEVWSSKESSCLRQHFYESVSVLYAVFQVKLEEVINRIKTTGEAIATASSPAH